MVKMSIKNPLKNEPRKPFITKLLSGHELRIFQARDQLLEMKDRLVNEQVLKHINNAVSELNGDQIDLYNIMNAYYSLDRIVMIRCDPRDFELITLKEEIRLIRQKLVVPYYKAMVEDQKKNILYLESLARKPIEDDEYTIPDLSYDLRKANEALAQLETFLKSSTAMDLLFELQDADVVKLGKSKEEAI